MSKIYDSNRQRKNYPLLRVKPVYKKCLLLDEFEEQSGIAVEVAIVDFDNSYQETYEFRNTYSEIPVIGLSAEDENVNVFITSLTNESLTIESSNNFTGKVHLQIFEST
jgi:hypothetical protein